jgi:O-antigen/teichoic acid export membrane protein
MPELARFGAPLMFTGLAGFLYGRVDMLFINAYLTANDSADYFLMFRLFEFPLMALGAYVFVLSRDVARRVGEGRLSSVQSLFWQAETRGVLFGLGMVALSYAVSYALPWVLPDYASAAPLVRLAAPLLLVKTVAQIASGAFLVSLGKPSALLGFTILGGALNILLNFILIEPYGVRGVVYATLVGHTTTGVLGIVMIALWVKRLHTPDSVASEAGS